MQEAPTFWKRLRGDLIFVGKRLIVYEVVILAVTGLLCLWRDWLTVNEFSLALLAVGALVFSVGPFAMMGGWGTTRNFQYLYGQSMSPDRIDQRAGQDRADMNRNMGLLLPSIVLGSLTMVVAVVVQTLFA